MSKKNKLTNEFINELKEQIKKEVLDELRDEIKKEVTNELKDEIKNEKKKKPDKEKEKNKKEDEEGKNDDVNVNLVDKSSEKYKLVLKYVNMILEKNNVTCINDLTEFKEVNRKILTNESNKKVFEYLEDDIIELFGKTSIKYYAKEKDNYIFNLTKYLCNSLNLKFKAIQRNKYNKGEIKKQIYYTITE